MALGYELLASCIAKGDLSEYIDMRLVEDDFRLSEQEVFHKFDTHIRKHGALPAEETFGLWLEEDYPAAPEVPSYYHELLRKRTVSDKLKEVKAAINNFSGKGADPETAFTKATEILLGMHLSKNRHKIIDFSQASELWAKDYKQHMIQGDDYGIQFGWDTLDVMTGGVIPGDLVSLVGRPAMGKTWKMLRLMHHAWYTQKKRCLFMSMEIMPMPLIQRMVALHNHWNISQIKNAQLSSKRFGKIFNELSLLKDHPAPCWIVDGNLTATVEDLYRLILQLEPDVVYMDGAYLMRHPDKRINRNERVNTNTELLKSGISTDCGIPVVASWQFNREVAKLKKGEEAGIHNIAGSDAIGQISSIVLGMFEGESVETIKTRRIEILKGRNGEVGEFRVNWDFNHMNFDEYIEPTLGDLQYA